MRTTEDQLGLSYLTMVLRISKVYCTFQLFCLMRHAILHDLCHALGWCSQGW